MPHIFVDISSHGFGHLAQTAPVLDALAEQVPGLHVTVRCGLPFDRMASRLRRPFSHICAASDFGFAMLDAMRVDHTLTRQRYQQQHAAWAAEVAQDRELLRSLRPDFVLSNVAYRPLVAAAQLGLPAAAMCSLDWADLFAHYYGDEKWAAPILREMSAAYAGADFLALEPAMPMPLLPHVHRMPPVIGAPLSGQTEKSAALRRHLPPGARAVLLAFGGIPTRLPVERWIAGDDRSDGADDIVWLCPGEWGIEHRRVLAIGSPGLPLPYSALLPACDAVVTKPGYGTFVEAAANAVPLLYLRRDDWPEQEALIEWLCRTATACELSAPDLAADRIGARLRALWQLERRPPLVTDGAATVAAWLAERIRR